MGYRTYFVGAALVVLVTGCSDRPSEELAESSLRREMAAELGSSAQLYGFKQTNGLMKNQEGIRVYQLEYSADVKTSNLTPRENMTGVLSFIKTEQGWRLGSVTWETDTAKRSREIQRGISQAKQGLIDLTAALQFFKLDAQRFPTQEQGLTALEVRPVVEPVPKYWRKDGYFKVPKDPWGMSYQYRAPGLHGEFDLYSFGPDRKEGGYGDDADIGNWDLP